MAFNFNTCVQTGSHKDFRFVTYAYSNVIHKLKVNISSAKTQEAESTQELMISLLLLNTD